jgi:Co/Zn/Cd efflux system component
MRSSPPYRRLLALPIRRPSASAFPQGSRYIKTSGPSLTFKSRPHTKRTRSPHSCEGSAKPPVATRTFSEQDDGIQGRGHWQDMSTRKKAFSRKTKKSSQSASRSAMPSLDIIVRQHQRVIVLVVAITASIFVIEMVVGHLVGSQALLADALDSFQDALTYGSGLAAAGTSIKRRAAFAVWRGVFLCLASLSVLSMSVYHMVVPQHPLPAYMAAVGLLAIAATAACNSLLSGLNEVSAALGPDRGVSYDAYVGNIAVVITAAAVWLFDSPWPDLLIGALASAVFLRVALLNVRQSILAYKRLQVA